MWIEVEEVVGLGADEVVRGGWSATANKGKLMSEQFSEEEDDTQRYRHSEEDAEQT